MGTWVFVGLGAAFGFVLSRAGASDYDVVQGMFLFENLHLFAVIGAAVAVTAPGLRLLARRGRSAFGDPIRIAAKPSHPGNVVGGLLFGTGWALTGMCPGPMFVAVGEGKLYGAAALAGALAGTALFTALRPRLMGPLRLEPTASACGGAYRSSDRDVVRI